MFERRAARRIPSRGARGTFNGRDVKIIDLSIEGVGMEAGLALKKGESGVMHLRHKALKDQVTIDVKDVWCRLPHGTTKPHLGLVFPTVTIGQRHGLRRLMAADAGSCVFGGNTHLGFLLSAAEGVWTVFRETTIKVAFINRESEGQYQMCVGGADPRKPPTYHKASSLLEALRTIFGVRTDPRLDPPIYEPGQEPAAEEPAAEDSSEDLATLQPWEQWAAKEDKRKKQENYVKTAKHKMMEAPDSIAGNVVRYEGAVVGYVALTGQSVWSLYDAGMNQVGVLSKTVSGYTVYWLGETPESSVNFVGAESFPAAIAVAFELENMPQLLSAPISPKTRSDTVPVTKQRGSFGSRVVFRKKLIGYVCASALDDSWEVLNKSMEQAALISRDDTPPHKFRVMLMGSSVEDSMEFCLEETMVGAVAAALMLPSAPMIDPPIEVPDPESAD